MEGHWQKIYVRDRPEACRNPKSKTESDSHEGLMTSWISGMLKSQKLRFQTPRSWNCRLTAGKEGSEVSAQTAPLPSRLGHSPPLTGNPLARAWLGHLAKYVQTKLATSTLKVCPAPDRCNCPIQHCSCSPFPPMHRAYTDELTSQVVVVLTKHLAGKQLQR